ncbi:histone-binding protein MSI1 homolog [Nymphaea colorata]|nr:histone-binding protein MSI1 homolog [Nymphaea colorata]
MEEYGIWKKNTPFLYDLVVSHALEWPSLTVQWLPDAPSGSAIPLRRLIFATHTAEDEPNYLMVADVVVPLEGCDGRALEKEIAGTEDDGGANNQIRLIRRINHDGEVNRARYMPQNSSIIATKTTSSDIYVFDYQKQPSGFTDGPCSPDMVLKGHKKEGFGLSWSPLKEGYLLSSSRDSYICLWDIGGSAQNILEAKERYESHEGDVGDVSWSWRNESLFGSVGDDHRLLIWDWRACKPNQPQHAIQAHEAEVNCLAFNPFNESILATGAADKTVNLFDMRKLNMPLHTFAAHTDAVFLLQWSPKNDHVLASGGDDGKVMVWDVNRIGDEQDPEDAEDGPPELLFIHGGHTEKVSDFSWSLNDDWLMSSVAEDNTLQIWQMAKNIYTEDDSEQNDVYL